VEPSASPTRHPRARLRAHLIALAVASGLGALALAGCGDTVGYDAGGGDRQHGRELFVANCGSCHELADAETTGTVGPNLDYAFYQYRVDASGADPDDPDFQARLAEPGVTSTVRNTVRGQIAYPVTDPPSGQPGMPADIVTGQDAEDVAAYVASVAGLGGDGGPPQAGGGGGDAGGDPGKAVFASAGCGGCHTLADAGAAGAVGPNLDESKPSESLAADRVRNGRGGMPSFEGQLSDEEIAAVAAYVASASGAG
jgi:mono/diheme cytochrome c family protein